jgi:hypothetical protein
MWRRRETPQKRCYLSTELHCTRIMSKKTVYIASTAYDTRCNRRFIHPLLSNLGRNRVLKPLVDFDSWWTHLLPCHVYVLCILINVVCIEDTK